MEKKIAILKGDGIGPEVTNQAIKALNAIAEVYGHKFNYTDGLMDHEHQGPKNWGEDSLVKFVIANGDKSPEMFNQLLLHHIDFEIKGKPIDDITLLTIRIL